MVKRSTKNTTPALAGGGEFRAVARFNSARSANELPKAHATAMVEALREVHVDDGEMGTKHDIELVRKDIARLESRIELSEERQTRKMAQQHTATIFVLGALMAAFRFWF